MEPGVTARDGGSGGLRSEHPSRPGRRFRFQGAHKLGPVCGRRRNATRRHSQAQEEGGHFDLRLPSEDRRDAQGRQPGPPGALSRIRVRPRTRQRGGVLAGIYGHPYPDSDTGIRVGPESLSRIPDSATGGGSWRGFQTKPRRRPLRPLDALTLGPVENAEPEAGAGPCVASTP